ncbi:MAG: hypothetical protein ACFE8L_09365 [Candidatus Hodarchaeota archaeon]
MKEYLLSKIKSPLFIIAGSFIVFFILISIFPQIITPYTFEEITGYLPGSWDSPSIDHPLGTASFGRDVLGLTIWGIKDALLFGFGAVIIGLIGSLVLSFFNWIAYFIRSHVKDSSTLILYYTLIFCVIIGFVISFFTFLIFGFTAILIGLIVGIILGFIVGILFFIISHRKPSDEQIDSYQLVNNVTLGSLIIFSILPGFIIILLSISIHGREYWLVMLVIGILLIPIFARAIFNVISREFNLRKIGKKIISHIPLGFAIAIIIYEVIGYLGFGPMETIDIHLGNQISVARMRLYISPLASFAPGIAITWVVMSFFILNIALQDYSSDFREF